MEHTNPFALVRASDYTDQQINSLWVDIGAKAIDSIIEPRSRVSKYILGGKGTGKTHLLRYFSYPAVRLRLPKTTGIEILKKTKFLAVFLRATGVDATRFEMSSDSPKKWQPLFGIYLELRLAEAVLDAICDIKRTSENYNFLDQGFIACVAESITDTSVAQFGSVEQFHQWIIQARREIDEKVNNAAFTGTLDISLPFSVGALSQSISTAIARLIPDLDNLPLIYLLDEVENFSPSQQEVVNTLIRYGGGRATFRVSGRLYARKTLATIGGGEENVEGAEFKTERLDELLQNYSGYSKFAKAFVERRLASVGLSNSKTNGFDSHQYFEEVRTGNFYTDAIDFVNFETTEKRFMRALIVGANTNPDIEKIKAAVARELCDVLTRDLPPILQKLNLLLFCKKLKPRASALELAKRIRIESQEFYSADQKPRSSYATAYGHWASDLFAQICRESRKTIPYAGFETFVKMSSGNPRNLLIVLGKAYSIAAFRDLDFINGPKLSIALQTEAAVEAAQFMYEADTNFGVQSEEARDAITRLASYLRTARYSLNIPEVSPLAVSFADEDLTTAARSVLVGALNYSFVFEILDGRPDRNNQRVNRKIQLNPLLSPRWGLPVSRRGDLSLGKLLLNAIFDPSQAHEFSSLLKVTTQKWDSPFKKAARQITQADLF